MSRVDPEEIDRMVQLDKVRLGRMNRRRVWCVGCGCFSFKARRLYLDGHDRGFLCWSCQEVLTV